jgi:hypothetical protein
MKWTNLRLASFALGLIALVSSNALFSSSALAAGSFSDPLTSFDASKFTVSEGTIPITFDSSGAHFGAGGDGDPSRAYLRTIADDYALTQSFVAELTFEVTHEQQDVFIGLGAGDMAPCCYGTPDWGTQYSSASFWIEHRNDKFARFRTANDSPSWTGDTGVPGFDLGVHRVRMSYDGSLQQLKAEIDLNYDGVQFVADAMTTNFPLSVTPLFAADGWPSEPSRIFFGGDDGVILRDFSLGAVVPEPGSLVSLLVGLGALGLRRTDRR